MAWNVASSESVEHPEHAVGWLGSMKAGHSPAEEEGKHPSGQSGRPEEALAVEGSP